MKKGMICTVIVSVFLIAGIGSTAIGVETPSKRKDSIDIINAEITVKLMKAKSRDLGYNSDLNNTYVVIEEVNGEGEIELTNGTTYSNSVLFELEVKKESYYNITAYCEGYDSCTIFENKFTENDPNVHLILYESKSKTINQKIGFIQIMLNNLNCMSTLVKTILSVIN